MTIPRIAIITTAVIAVCVLFDVFFGTDSGGLRHDVSVLAWLAAAAGVVVLAACAVVSVARKVRRPVR